MDSGSSDWAVSYGRLVLRIPFLLSLSLGGAAKVGRAEPWKNGELWELRMGGGASIEVSTFQLSCTHCGSKGLWL